MLAPRRVSGFCTFSLVALSQPSALTFTISYRPHHPLSYNRKKKKGSSKRIGASSSTTVLHCKVSWRKEVDRTSGISSDLGTEIIREHFSISWRTVSDAYASQLTTLQFHSHFHTFLQSSWTVLLLSLVIFQEYLECEVSSFEDVVSEKNSNMFLQLIETITHFLQYSLSLRYLELWQWQRILPEAAQRWWYSTLRNWCHSRTQTNALGHLEAVERRCRLLNWHE